MGKNIGGLKNLTIITLFIILILSPILFLGFYIYFFTEPIPEEIYLGNPSENFCQEKCGNFNLMISNNNSDFNFIRCECVESLQIDATYSLVSSRLKTNVYYFDLENLEEISEKEVLNRIYDKN